VSSQNGSGDLSPQAITRIVLRPMASGLPLGFLAFGTRTILVTTLSAAWATTAIIMLGGPPGARSSALGIFLLTLASLMLVLFGSSLQAKPLFGVLLLMGPAGSR
jgi:hypothetical protein